MCNPGSSSSSYLYSGSKEEKKDILSRERAEEILTNAGGLLDATGQHVSFYTSCTNEDYRGTSWCEEHCYIRRIPFNLCYYDEGYKQYINHRLSPMDISPKRMLNPAFYQGAKYVTFCAEGHFEHLFDTFVSFKFLMDYYRQEIPEPFINCSFKECYEFYIELLPWKFPEKVFRFFTRSIKTVKNFQKKYKNQVMIVSVDCASDMEFIQVALGNEEVSVSVIKHQDNEFLIAYLKEYATLHKINIVDCETCQNQNFQCFKANKKSIILMDYK